MNKYINLTHFKLSEFDCKCGCGLNNMDLKILLMIDVARTIAKVPFIVNSGSRCKKHNEDIGGLKNSTHLKGLAVDIKCDNDVIRHKIIGALLIAGFKRILIYKNFIHIDIDLDRKNPIIKIME